MANEQHALTKPALAALGLLSLLLAGAMMGMRIAEAANATPPIVALQEKMLADKLDALAAEVHDVNQRLRGVERAMVSRGARQVER